MQSGENLASSCFFVSHDKFNEMIVNGKFLEYADVFGNKYGTPKEYVMSKLNEGKDVLLEIDVQGAMMVMESYSQAIFIFILPPSIDELEKRLINRKTENKEQLELRLNKAKLEIGYAEKFDYVVVNDDANRAANEIISIIMSEKCSTKRNKKVIKDLIKL